MVGEPVPVTTEQNIETNSTPPKQTATLNNGKPPKMVASKMTITVLLVLGATLLIGGILVGSFWMSIYDSIVLRELILTPTSTSYDMWRETPIPMYLYLYLYNWTNTEEFSNSAAEKPNFEQHGPYVFKEVHIKVNETWNDNGTVTFRQIRVWHFEESMSNGSLDDEITNLNIMAVTVGHMVRNWSPLIQRFVNNTLVNLNQTMFVTKTAGELLFDGYDNALLDLLKILNISTINIPFDKFGWFYGRNGSETYDGTFNMYTGVKDISNLGMMDNWNYNNETDHWSGECNAIRGSTGELWPPVTGDETVEIFAPDICTSVILYRKNDSNVLDVTGQSYAAEEATFDNGTKVSSRACYCTSDTCQPSGVLDVSGCKFGAPAYVSLPHFYLADDSYLDAITGMEPKREEHDFAITLEPNTGIPLDVAARLQINIKVEPVNHISIFENIPETFIPVLWFSQTAQLTDIYARQIKFLLTLPTLGHIIFIIIACIGVLLALIAGFLIYRRSRLGEENQSLISPSDRSNIARNEPIIS